MSAVVGEVAPGFTLPTDRWENEVSLDDYTKEGPLLFDPGDRSSVCTHQIGDRPGIGRSETQRMEFPFLADFDSQAMEGYGVRQEDGCPERAYFIIDREGVESSARNQPEVEAVLEVLDGAL